MGSTGSTAMKTRSQLVMSALIIVAGGAVFWFLGWFLWCQLEGWTVIKNTTFQQLLLLLISAWILGSLAVTHHRRSPQNTEANTRPKNNPHPHSEPCPHFEDLSGKVDELLEKQTDFHAIMRFFKTRAQKDSLRKRVNKSEIKLEISPELAEKLKPKKPQAKAEEKA